MHLTKNLCGNRSRIMFVHEKFRVSSFNTIQLIYYLFFVVHIPIILPYNDDDEGEDEEDSDGEWELKKW